MRNMWAKFRTEIPSNCRNKLQKSWGGETFLPHPVQNNACAVYLTSTAESVYSLPGRVKNSSSFHCSVSNVGLSMSSLCQHSSMISYSDWGHPGGQGIRYPCSTWWRTSAFVIPDSNIRACKSRQLTFTPTNSAFHPFRFGKWEVIHVITWITRVATIKRQTRAGHGCWSQA